MGLVPFPLQIYKQPAFLVKRIHRDTGLSQQLKARFYTLIYEFKGGRCRFAADEAHAVAFNLIDMTEHAGQMAIFTAKRREKEQPTEALIELCHPQRCKERSLSNANNTDRFF